MSWKLKEDNELREQDKQRKHLDSVLEGQHKLTREDVMRLHRWKN